MCEDKKFSIMSDYQSAFQLLTALLQAEDKAKPCKPTMFR